MSDERQNWRKAFEMIGPEQLRLRLEHRRNEYTGDYGREAELWLFEKATEAAAIDRKRFQTIRRWAIIAGLAAIVVAITGLIAAWPIIKEWIDDASRFASLIGGRKSMPRKRKLEHEPEVNVEALLEAIRGDIASKLSNERTPPPPQTFGFESCVDLVWKLYWEIERLHHATPHNVIDMKCFAFNAAVTAWALTDWVFLEMTQAQRTATVQARCPSSRNWPGGSVGRFTYAGRLQPHLSIEL